MAIGPQRHREANLFEANKGSDKTFLFVRRRRGREQHYRECSEFRKYRKQSIQALWVSELHDSHPVPSSTLATDYAKFQNALDAYVTEKMAA